jgi:hypothetical protein
MIMQYIALCTPDIAFVLVPHTLHTRALGGKWRIVGWDGRGV